MDGVSVFVGSLLIVVAVVGGVARRDESNRRWFFVALFGLFLAAAIFPRDLLWIYVGFEVFSLSETPFRAPRAHRLERHSLRSPAHRGLGAHHRPCRHRAQDGGERRCHLVRGGTHHQVAAGARRAVLVPGRGRHSRRRVRPGPGVAPGVADELEAMRWLAAAAAIVLGGVGAALVSSTRSLAVWLTVFTVGLAVVALSGGAPALPHLLMHLAASTVLLALVLSGAPPVGTWLAMLSLASVPSFSGFVTKLALVAGLAPASMTVVLVGLLFAGWGARGRWSDQQRKDRRAG